LASVKSVCELKVSKIPSSSWSPLDTLGFVSAHILKQLVLKLKFISSFQCAFLLVYFFKWLRESLLNTCVPLCCSIMAKCTSQLGNAVLNFGKF
jgi:hypothetical protein